MELCIQNWIYSIALFTLGDHSIDSLDFEASARNIFGTDNYFDKVTDLEEPEQPMEDTSSFVFNDDYHNSSSEDFSSSKMYDEDSEMLGNKEIWYLQRLINMFSSKLNL